MNLETTRLFGPHTSLSSPLIWPLLSCATVYRRE